jgi:hypothetical protein
MTKTWTLPVQIDADSGDHYIELNEEILAQSGFNVGDTIEWQDNGDGSWTLVKKDQELKTYLVETVSMFRHRYAVQARSLEHAYDTVVCNEAEEFSQHHIDENIVSGREITKAEYLKLFNEDNDYLKNHVDEFKLKYIHTVNYDR